MGSPVCMKGVDCRALLQCFLVFFFWLQAEFECVCYLWLCSHPGMQTQWELLNGWGLSIPYAVFTPCLFVLSQL